VDGNKNMYDFLENLSSCKRDCSDRFTFFKGVANISFKDKYSQAVD